MILVIYYFFNILIEIPKFSLNLHALKLSNLPSEDVIKLLKEQNKFLLEETPEEKILSEKLKTFSYIDDGEDDVIFKQN